MELIQIVDIVCPVVTMHAIDATTAPDLRYLELCHENFDLY